MTTTVYSHTPLSSITPWDYYARIHMESVTNTLDSVGIKFSIIEQKNTDSNPIGTGPNAKIRLGDDMLPSTYHIRVNPSDAERAIHLLAYRHNSLKDNAYALLS